MTARRDRAASSSEHVGPRGGGRPPGELPLVAICVPVGGPGAELERLLSAIETEGWPTDRKVVVVALDGPDEEAAATAETSGAQVVALPRRSGSYAARNAALDHLPAEVDVVVFTDADCIPQRGWIRAHVEALHSCDLSGGAIDVTLREPPSPAEYVDKLRHLHQESYVKRDGYAATANLAVKHEVTHLRFDARLISGGDAEFCQRARAAGFALRYTPSAVVQHPARQTAAELGRKVRRICEGIRARPELWASRPIPPVRPPHHLVSRARRDGASRGIWWEIRAAYLYLSSDIRIARAARAAKRRASPSTAR